MEVLVDVSVLANLVGVFKPLWRNRHELIDIKPDAVVLTNINRDEHPAIQEMLRMVRIDLNDFVKHKRPEDVPAERVAPVPKKSSHDHLIKSVSTVVDATVADYT